ncbi:MAG: DsrE family protein [Saprospiraceae bacterium]|nr:DsrE family protein [Saprospiraceae bacterium]
MKFSLLFFLISLLALSSAFAQNNAAVDNTPYKIVFQLTSGDTAVHRALTKQLNNALTAAPKSQLEVVCHNQGISFLVGSKTIVPEKIRELKKRGVVFVACENTMRDRKIKREELVPEAGTVPAGIIEIVKKQRKHWAYIKAG